MHARCITLRALTYLVQGFRSIKIFDMPVFPVGRWPSQLYPILPICPHFQIPKLPPYCLRTATSHSTCLNFFIFKKNSSAGAKIERTYTILFLNAICVQASPPCSPRLRCLVFPLGSCLPVIRVKNYPAAASKSELLSLASSVSGPAPAAHASSTQVRRQSHCSVTL